MSNTNTPQFTQEQINQWHAYELVRLSGEFNMFASQAGSAAGLSPEEHIFVIQHYTELKAAAFAQEDSEILRLAEYYGH